MRLSAPDNTFLIEERTGLTPSDIASFCQHWQVTQMAVFGSVLRNDFNPDSDIDILIRFSPGARQGLLTLAQMKYQLEDRTGRLIFVLGVAKWCKSMPKTRCAIVTPLIFKYR